MLPDLAVQMQREKGTFVREELNSLLRKQLAERKQLGGQVKGVRGGGAVRFRRLNSNQIMLVPAASGLLPK